MRYTATMQDEMDALRQNYTWTSVPQTLAYNTVGSKWAYHTKFKFDCSIECLKACMVDQNFTLVPGLYYSHTFSLVVKASTTHIVLSLDILNRWNLHQLDIENSFLHGHLLKLSTWNNHLGLLLLNFPIMFCKFSKALYRLKQDPCAWFHRLSSFLLTNGFMCSRYDTSLLLFSQDSCIMYLLLYVDGLILIGNHESTIASFITLSILNFPL